MDETRYPLLAKIDCPADLRSLRPDQLRSVADELRGFLLDSIASCGGHFGGGLGAVEITTALHYVFNTPHDRIVWDVGHQCYPHKILTGRKDRITTIRTQGGLAPFPKRCESEHDHFGTGHSSTSIGAALGMAIASAKQNTGRHVIAVIGDGGITGGMAYEALNHLGASDANLLVILNDNEMSISPNIGAMTNYLTRILSGQMSATISKSSEKLLQPIPFANEFVERITEHVKGVVTPPGTLFEELGVSYYGPANGHDINSLTKILQNLKRLKGPRLLHICTVKGKGYAKAESDPVGYHAVPTFEPEVGVVKSGAQPKVTYTKVFSDWLCDIAKQDDRVMAITPAMREGSGLVQFSKEFPDRYFDVAIAEQHSVTLAAGMACENAKPVVAIYSTFLQRAYDQLIHDVAVQNLPVMFAIDRAGVVGGDGQTHAGSFDLTYLRCVPNMVVMTPGDENETRRMLYTAYLQECPAAVRYPRGSGPGIPVEPEMKAVEVGKAKVIRQGKRIAILAFGSPVYDALEVGEQLDATVVNMRFVKPIDQALIIDIAKAHDCIVTVEDNAVMGGAGSAVNEVLAVSRIPVCIKNLGLPDHYLDHATREEQLSDAGLDTVCILKSIQQFVEEIQEKKEKKPAAKQVRKRKPKTAS
ncbi:MAG: 1-deoxy-D-xylulose-5-phosphate synthase [Gammaproteobacteria bacterium]|nr:1-deoxy-D-xylulose-5-phosphate synthase [Gammaproteobacteria bacterium]